jgi:hypothetical protein
MTTVLFHDGWVASNLTGVPDYSGLQGIAQEAVLSRAPSLSLLWPAAALGLSLGARSTAAAAAWFLVPTVAALVDVLHGRAPLLARVVLAIGGIGVFNEVAVLVDGQVNQTFALAVMVATVWGYYWLKSGRARCLLLALAGASVAAGYPEFLPAVPLYLLCCALLRAWGMRNTILDAAALAARVAHWAAREMFDPRGFFYYQKQRFRTVRTPYMRWSQAWMMYGLARFLEVMSDE